MFLTFKITQSKLILTPILHVTIKTLPLINGFVYTGFQAVSLFEKSPGITLLN